MRSKWLWVKFLSCHVLKTTYINAVLMFQIRNLRLLHENALPSKTVKCFKLQEAHTPSCICHQTQQVNKCIIAIHLHFSLILKCIVFAFFGLLSFVKLFQVLEIIHSQKNPGFVENSDLHAYVYFNNIYKSHWCNKSCLNVIIMN